jgi:16S rRNA (adenine1518-N6/adenine1519-N6)-dimethyltransferase
MLQHKAKKSLGQNFLTALRVVDDIVHAGEVTAGDTVLEIGPGKGVLTRALLKTGATVLAVEKDDALFVYLQNEFNEYISSGKFMILNADILEILPTLKLPTQYKLVANIPYNITGKILSDFLSYKNKPSKMVLMVQYEVAARIASKSEKSSILRIAVQAYGKAKLIKRVSAGSFFPKPRVDSAILLIDSISSNLFDSNKVSEDIFFKVVKSGFAHKRKKLSSNLRDAFPETDWLRIFNEIDLKENTRPEELSIETWITLSKKNLQTLV